MPSTGMRTFAITRNLILVSIAPLLLSGSTCGAQAAKVKSRAKITVDCNQSRGPLLRTEKYNNVAEAKDYSSQRSTDVQFYNDQGLHGKVYRVWLFQQSLYDNGSKTLNKSVTSYLDDVSKLSDSILVNLSVADSIRELPPASAGQMEPSIERILKDLKQAYPRIKYIEPFNEPDYGLRNIVKPETLYSYYVPFYEAVNKVNRELAPSVPLQLGGPALFQFNLPWLRPFLDSYKNDKNPEKRLDFISYHGYGIFTMTNGNVTGAHFFRDNPSEVASQRSQIDAELSSRGLDLNTPSFITETGLYPGPSFDELKGYEDMLRQPAGMASLFYWYIENPKNYPFNWVFRHQSEERKDTLVSRVPGDKSTVPTETFTPYGNMMVMMSKMKTTRVSASSDAIKDGIGVYAIGSMDSSGVSVIAWNYQHMSAEPYVAEVTISNLPSTIAGKNVQEKIYRIDSATSNYYSNPKHSNLQMVSNRIVTLGKVFSTPVEFQPNALQLIVLEPVSSDALLQSMFDDEVPGALPSWTASEPAGSTVTIASKPSAENRSAYLSSISIVEPVSMTKKFGNQTGTVSAEWRFMEGTQLASDRFQLLSKTTIDVEVSVNGRGGVVVGGRQLQNLSPQSWHTVKVVADIAKHKYDVYLDDAIAARALALPSSVTGLDTVGVVSSGVGKTELYVDSVRVARGKAVFP